MFADFPGWRYPHCSALLSCLLPCPAVRHSHSQLRRDEVLGGLLLFH